MQSLIRSGDGGRTWRQVLTIENLGCFHASIDPESDAVYVAPINGYAWRVEGEDSQLTMLIDGAGSIVVDPLVPRILYANRPVEDGSGGYVNQIQRSTNRGVTWAPLGPKGVSVSAIDPANHAILYSIGEGFQRSDDGGNTWTPFPSAPSLIRDFAFGGGSVPSLYVVSYEGRLYRSFDRGTTWTELDTPAVFGLRIAVTYPDGNVPELCLGTQYAGVFCSSDEGASWVSRNRGLNGATVAAMAIAPSNPRIAYALGGTFARTDDAGATWSIDVRPSTSPTGDVAVDPKNPDIVYASAYSSGVLRSADGGATWLPAAPIESPVTSIAIDPESPATLYAADGRLWKSTDSGTSWSIAGAGLPNGVDLVVVDASDHDVLYAAAPALYRSADAGASWSLVYDRGVSSVASDPAHPGTVYAAEFFGVVKSEDFGATWSLTTPFNTTPYQLACDSRGFVYASGYYSAPQLSGAGNELLRSLDGGASWEPASDWSAGTFGFPETILRLAVDPSASRLYAATNMGVWQLPLRAPKEMTRAVP